MWPWIKRWLGRPAPDAAGDGARAAVPQPAPLTAPLPDALPVRGPLVGAAVAVAVAEAAEPAPGFSPRRPLVGRQGQVAGFELRLSPGAERFLARRGDSPGAALHYAALLSSAAHIAAGGRRALVKIPAALLARQTVADAAGAGVLLWVDDLAAVPAETAGVLRGRGAQLGVAAGALAAALPADFVVMHAGMGLDALLLSAQRWRERLPRVAVIGLDFEQIEDMEAALRSECALAAGQLGRSRTPPPQRALGAAAHRICELLNHLALDRDTAHVAEALRGDATLAYRLLRYANSPVVGAKAGVESVDTAVTLIGRHELRRWLSVQLTLSAGEGRPAAKALEEGALVRGRVLELLASALGEPHPGAQFTLGLLSLIEPLLQVPLADAIGPLRLGDEATAALLRHQGPWAARLQLLDALDAGAGDQAESLAVGLGLAEGGLTAIVDGAWAWAAQLREAGAGP